MQLIKISESADDCRQCHHYFYLPGERLCHGCRAMEYIGKKPASETVLTTEERDCPLFASSAGPPP